ncbi:MAG TPA: guanylate kinase [Tissierellales bacterium]|nr:guanylate kinase [Tissierellales bacterium]
MDEGLLLVISGPSGSGKGTICRELLKRHQNINFSISATTRKPRKGEDHGISYFFIGEEKFKDMIRKEEFLEYANVHDNYYGTPKKYVFEKMEQGENIILEIDVQGALQVRKVYPEAVLIFILPPSMEELKNRIVKRGTESEKDISRRLENAYKEMEFGKNYDYVVMNDQVITAVEKIESIITAEKIRGVRQKELIEQILL